MPNLITISVRFRILFLFVCYSGLTSKHSPFLCCKKSVQMGFACVNVLIPIFFTVDTLLFIVFDIYIVVIPSDRIERFIHEKKKKHFVIAIGRICPI
jgi:hypothetical protein